MKCLKCYQEMQRKKYDESRYYYECPNCFHTIGKPEQVKEDQHEIEKQEKEE